MDETKTRENPLSPALRKTLEATRVRFKISACPVTRVTVFSDRAEVTRTVSVQPEATGPHEIWVQAITNKIDEESVRVKGIGSCEIQEVSVDTHMVSESTDDLTSSERETKIGKLEADIKTIDREITRIADKKTDIQLRLRLLGEYMEGMMTKTTPKDSTGTCAILASSLKENELDNVGRLFDFYSAKSTELNEEMHRNDYLIHDEQEKRNEMQTNVSLLMRGRQLKNVQSRDVTILINVREVSALPIELLVTYLVTGASWNPCYDIRISSEDNSMSLTYFGLVKQGTGEDWNNCEIRLSTAKPSVGGTPPLLPQRTASFNAPLFIPSSINVPNPGGRVAVPTNRNYRAPESRGRHAERFQASNMQSLAGATMFQEEEPEPDANVSPVAAVSTASVNSDAAGSTTFTIPRQATIESDNKAHKVTIGIVSLQPTIMHYVPAAIDANAYLQTKVRNTSDYPFLPSDKVSVFFDGNFMTTTQMRFVSPGEIFQNFLGRDPAVKVDYRPVRQTDRVSGVLTRTKSSLYEQQTIITNNKQVAIKLIVADVLPRSNDERIKIELQSPTMAEIKRSDERHKKSASDSSTSAAASSSGFGGWLSVADDDNTTGHASDDATESVSQNALTNNIVWTKTMNPDTTQTFSLTYTISHAADQQVYVS